jgi:hypothetical protein
MAVVAQRGECAKARDRTAGRDSLLSRASSSFAGPSSERTPDAIRPICPLRPVFAGPATDKTADRAATSQDFPIANFCAFCGCFSQFSTKSVDISKACNPVLPRLLRILVKIILKCFSGNNLQLFSGFSGQGQSNPIKPNQGKKSPVWVCQCGAYLLNPYQTSRDYERRRH